MRQFDWRAGRDDLCKVLVGMRVPEKDAAAIADALRDPDEAVVGNAWKELRRILCPDTCSGDVSNMFWASVAGQYVAEALWAVYGSQAVGLSDAIRYLYGSSRPMVVITSADYTSLSDTMAAFGLSMYRKPNSVLPVNLVVRMRARGDGNVMGGRVRYVLRRDLERLKAALESEAQTP